LAAAWQTVAIATAGLSLALLLGVPLAFLACDTLSISALPSGQMSFAASVVRRGVRGLLVVLRSVPELVWALLLVRVVGLGPTAGVLAIALSYSGMLGKVFAEVVDSAPRAASRALLVQGASRWSALLHAVLPQSAAELLSYTLFRWECAVRGTVMMGFVGAGGLGQQMEISMKMFAGGEVVTLLAVFVALVALADVVSKRLRGAL
jgi:phosphonate transport system permease protein